MLLLIPGPVTTRPEVRAALAQDFAPWDTDFQPVYDAVRQRVEAIAGAVPNIHAALILQGCGHFAMEAAIRSFIPAGGKLLIPMTGQYADRMARLAQEAERIVIPLAVPGTGRIDGDAVARALDADHAISHVSYVYSETSTGIVHDPVAIGAAVRRAGRRVLLDAVSAFGALPLDLAAHPEIDAVVSTANKCLEGVPGLGLIVVRGDTLLAGAGRARSWSFDLCDVYKHAVQQRAGFRFTPPAQVLNALRTALDLFAQEGGRASRLARYNANMRVFYDGIARLGLTPSLPRELQGPIVVNVQAPADPAWNLQHFVDALKARGVLISNFYNTPTPSFRVGCIGAIGPDAMRFALGAMRDALGDIGIMRFEAA